MGDLIYRSNINQDWISLIFLINLILIFSLFYIDPFRLKRLVQFYSTDMYLSKHISEKNLNYLSFFNLICFLIILSTIGLTFIVASKFGNYQIKYAFEFYYIIISFLLFFTFRFFIVQSIMIKLNLLTNLRLLYFRVFTHNIQFALLYLIFLFFCNYTSIGIIIYLLFSIFLVILWFFYQTRVVLSFFQTRPTDVLYIILYLCTFKIIPWYWFYLFSIKPILQL